MKIHHLAIWVKDLEKMRRFYETYFGAKSGELYINVKKGFRSYFLSFEDGCSLELMHIEELQTSDKSLKYFGLAHFALEPKCRNDLYLMTERLEKEGVQCIGKPRVTGDGYLESVFKDPEGNVVELCIKAESNQD